MQIKHAWFSHNSFLLLKWPAAFNIMTIAELGAWKHYQAARSIAILAKTEVWDTVEAHT